MDEISPLQYLDFLHRHLRNDNSPDAQLRYRAVAEAFRACGLIDGPTYSARLRNIRHCPGHGDEDGRDWCAYCGIMPSTKETQHGRARTS